MNQSNVLGKNEYFISDLGQLLTDPDHPLAAQRFAVWKNAVDQQQLQLVEVGSQLPLLQEKYHIPDERIGIVGV